MDGIFYVGLHRVGFQVKLDVQCIVGIIVTAILNARDRSLCFDSFISYFEMIKAILVFNNHGKPRMIKFFTHYVSGMPLYLILHKGQTYKLKAFLITKIDIL